MIRATGLNKGFAAVQALRDLDLHVRRGECYGLLGPNGAGKTTAINILSTVLRPDSGSIQIDDRDLANDTQAVKRRIGVVSQELALYEELSALDNLLFWGALYGLNEAELRHSAEDKLRLVGLADRANEPVKNYSGGMKRRVHIASALVHQPALLFLDEPTVGIDPQSRNHIYEVLEQLRGSGLTILYTTHYMDEAERLCDRIGIIDHGQIIAEGALAELQKMHGRNVNIFVRAVGDWDAAWPCLLGDFGERVKRDDHAQNLISLEPKSIQEDIAKLMSICSNSGLEIQSLEVEQANLESIFLELTGKELRD